MLLIAGNNCPHATTSEVAETNLETEVVPSLNEVDGEGELGELGLAVKAWYIIHVSRIEAEGNAKFVIVVGICAEDVFANVDSLKEDVAAAVIVLLTTSVEFLKSFLKVSLDFSILCKVDILRVELGSEHIKELDGEFRVESECLKASILSVHDGVNV